MNLYDHYSRNESDRERRWKAVELKQYNYWVETLLRIFRDMVAKARITPPATCNWIYENGRKIVSWKLATQPWNEDNHLNLTEDGRLLETSREVSFAPSRVVREIHLRRISSFADIGPTDLDHGYLSALFYGVASSGLLRFGLPRGNFLDNTSQQWFRTHPEDDPNRW